MMQTSATYVVRCFVGERRITLGELNHCAPERPDVHLKEQEKTRGRKRRKKKEEGRKEERTKERKRERMKERKKNAKRERRKISEMLLLHRHVRVRYMALVAQSQAQSNWATLHTQTK